MALNFNELPSTRPAGGAFPVIEDKYCIGTVKSAEAKVSTGTNTAGQAQLAVVFDCVSFDGTVNTRIWENFYESEKSLMRYKLRQFIMALGLKLNGEFTMADLAKIVVNKKLIIATKLEDKPNGDKKNVVNAYDDGVFYPMSELAAMKGETQEDDTPPFNASDGETPFSNTSEGHENLTRSDNY